MFGRRVWEADAGDTAVHRLDARIKLAVLVLLGVAAVLIDSPRTLFLLFAATVAGHGAARSSLDRWTVLAVFLLFGIWGSMVSQGIFYSQEPRSPLVCLVAPGTPVVGALTGGVYIYGEGLAYGAVQGLRSCVMLTGGFLLCWTTDPRELLRGFVFWRLPYELSFMAVTGLRFLPVIFGETAAVIAAQRLRGGATLRAVSPAGVVGTAFRTLWPVLARSLRRAVTLAMSVESRGFGHGRVAPLPPLTWRGRAALGFCLTAATALGAAKLVYALQYNGWVYFAACRGVYDFARRWL